MGESGGSVTATPSVVRLEDPEQQFGLQSRRKTKSRGQRTASGRSNADGGSEGGRQALSGAAEDGDDHIGGGLSRGPPMHGAHGQCEVGTEATQSRQHCIWGSIFDIHKFAVLDRDVDQARVAQSWT